MSLIETRETTGRWARDAQGQYALIFLGYVMSLPGGEIDRVSFLRSQFRSHFPEDQIEHAIAYNPARAGMPIRKIDTIADSVIKKHLLAVGVSSLAAGWPGGPLVLATLPANVFQQLFNSAVLVQKLAYLYGWKDLAESADIDDETEYRVGQLFLWMIGAGKANLAVGCASMRVADQVGKRVPRQALTKTPYYVPLKRALRWFGVSLNKKSFGKSLAKAVPVVGGVASAGVTTVTLRRNARRLKRHVRELEFAQPGRNQIRIEVDP